MEIEIKNFNIPYYIVEEIVEYIEQTAMGKCRCMKWQNIRALLRLSIVNGGITKEQADFIECKYCRENKKS